MGESACVVNSFSYASGMPSEPVNPGNHVHALGDSVSFGRFTSETLAWEKWSTFTNKRYVEEAKSYAQPGSVAQKKAFFEAHYKRIAAQKAAAAAAATESHVEERVCGTSQNTYDSEAAAFLDPCDSQTRLSNCHDPAEERQIMSPDARKGTDDVARSSVASLAEPEINITVRSTNRMIEESLNNLENLDDHVAVSEDSRASQIERPLLKAKSNTDQEVSQPTIKRKPTLPSVGRKPCSIPPAKYVISLHPMKENITAPRTENATTFDPIDKRRPTPKSLYMLMNSGSSREPFKVSFPAARDADSTKPAPAARTTPKRRGTAMSTPTKAFTSMANKQPLATPLKVKRRMETPVHPSAAESRTSAPKWHILSAVSKSLSAYRNKLQSPTISSPFVLRTEERAARRKQKLEERFHEKEAQKVQLQAKLKEKAETGFGRLRQSFCFKAQPLPDFYKERETPFKNQTEMRRRTHKK